MANYNLVINSRFSPFSYQELLAPVLQATQAHQALEEAYNNIDTQGESIGSKINKDLDPTAYKRYQDYKQALDAQADELAKHGLNVGSRRALFKVRSDFAKNIMPIQEAITRRRQLAEEQRKALLSNPTLFFQRDFTTLNNTSSLDRFLENPEYDYGDRASGALIEQQVGEAVSNLKTWLRSKGKLKGVGIPYQYEQLVQYGFKPEEILNAIQNPSEGDPILTKIVNDTLQASGILDWGSPQQIKEATAFANRGLWKSVGETKIQNYTDQYGMSSALAREAEARAAAREAERQKQAQLNSIAINPLNIYSSRERSEDEKRYNDNMKYYSKYFYKDNGQWKMTQAGWKEYNRKVEGTTGDTMVTPEGTTILTNVKTVYYDSPFKKFMNSIGFSGIGSKFGPNQAKNAGATWGRYSGESPAAGTARYDATKVTEFDYPIASSQQGDMKDAIMTANRGFSLREVDYDNKSRQFRDTGEEITMKDLKNDKYKVTATRFSPYGNTVMIQDDEGNVRRFRMPAGINITNEQNRDRAMAAAQKWQDVINTGKYTDSRGVEHTATADEIAMAQQNYVSSLQQAYLFHSQLGVQNKTKEQEFQPYGY